VTASADSYALKSTLQFGAKGWAIHSSSTTAHDYIEVNRRQAVAMLTKKLTDLALDPIAHNSPPYFTTGCHPESGISKLILMPDNQEGRSGKTGPANREPGKLWPPQKTYGLWIHCAC
jgi:hypothetical protein